MTPWMQLAGSFSQGYNHPAPGSFLAGLAVLTVIGAAVRAVFRRRR